MSLDRCDNAANVSHMATTTLDFSAGLSEHDVKVRSHSTKLVWFTRLGELANAVNDADSPAKYDTFYQVGEFKAASGARSAIRNLEERVENGDVLPGEFDLRSLPGKVGDNDKRGSELWAAVVSGDADEDQDEADEPVEDEREHIKAKRARKDAA